MKLGPIYFVTPGPAQGLHHSCQSRLSKLCSEEGKAKEGFIKETIELSIEVKEFPRLTTGRDGIGKKKSKERIRAKELVQICEQAWPIEETASSLVYLK